MEEEIYKIMKAAGISNLVLGICLMTAAVAVGVSMIVTASKLLVGKSKLMF